MLNPTQLELFDKPFYPIKQSPTLNARSGTFVDNMKLPVHRWFRYSAGFSAQWAENLINEYSPTTVLDPFAGSGTTLLAAEAAGVKAFGYESHPFVARIASAKICWNLPSEKLIETADEIIKIAVANNKTELTNVPELLTKCYTPDVLLQLYYLRDAYLYLSPNLDHKLSDLIWLVISSILRSCSHVGTAQWQYILPNKRKAKIALPFDAFAQKISDMVADMAVLKNNAQRDDAVIYCHDARLEQNNIPKNSIDLVITSPPYPNNFDYADATRLEMMFWGEINGWCDLQETVRKFIIRSSSQHSTAEKLKLESLLVDSSVESIHDELAQVCNELAKVRLTKGGKKAYHTMVAAYFSDLSKVFQTLRPICKSGSNLCFVVGDSAPYGVYVPAEKWLGTLALATGFNSYSFEKLRDRNIKWKNRKHQVPLHEGRLWIKG